MKKYIYLTLLSLIALVGFTACSDDDHEYEPATASGEQVYFSNALPSTVELSKSESSTTIQLNRINTSGSISVPLNVKKGAGSYMTYPSTVTFADGEATATIEATYNPDDVEYGTYVTDTLSIGDETYTTPYGLSQYGFTFGATEWVDYGSNSNASYREDILTTFWTVDNYVYTVKIEKSVVTDGRYRLVNPYSNYPGASQDVLGGTYDSSTDHYWVIDASDPDMVYLESFDTGYNPGYGEVHIKSMVSWYIEGGYTLEQIKTSHPEFFGTLKDGIITMPTRGLLLRMPDYSSSLYYANTNGKFAIALPGYAIADYDVDAEYTGRFTDTDKQDYGVYTLTYGSDVASTKSALVLSSDWSSNSDAVLSGIEDGSISSIESTSAGTINVPYGETGTYVLVVVIYNSDGEVVGNWVSDEIKLRNSSDAEEKFTDIAAGTLTFGAADVSSILWPSSGPWGTFPTALQMSEPSFSQEAVLSQSQSDATHFKLTPFWQEGYDLDFYVQEDGSIVVDGVDTGIAGDGVNIRVQDLVTFSGYNQATALQYGFASYVENNTYTFNLLYLDNTYYYAAETETFEVTATAAKALKAAKAKALRAAAKKHNKKSVSAQAHSKSSLKVLFKGASAYRVK